MSHGPIIEEVRATRERLAAAFDYDIHRIFADLRRRQHESGHPLVAPRRPPESAPTDAGSRSDPGTTDGP